MERILSCVLPAEYQQPPDPTDISDGESTVGALPSRTTLWPNSPNPFNPATTIRFDVARAGHVQVTIHNANGRRLRTLVDAYLERDAHAAVWDGRDDSGRQVASGVYFYKLETADAMGTRKMVLMR